MSNFTTGLLIGAMAADEENKECDCPKCPEEPKYYEFVGVNEGLGGPVKIIYGGLPGGEFFLALTVTILVLGVFVSFIGIASYYEQKMLKKEAEQKKYKFNTSPDGKIPH